MTTVGPGATPRPVFPFGAVVGHDDAKLALRLAAVDPLIGGVLLRGDKGAAKTTLARGLAALLGDVPFVELPLGATEDRLVGTLDARAALSGGDIVFQPGLLAAAHGGVLYIDEINLLPDHLVDVLLDVAVSGENRVERDGVSHRHPARFVLIGSMNPEEGELRPQLLDRFGLCVTVIATSDIDERVESVRRRLTFDTTGSLPGIDTSVSMPDATRDLTDIADEVVDAACRLAVEVGVEGMRADITLCRSAAALAAIRGDAAITIDHVREVAPLVLAHRSRRGPFDPPVLPPEQLEQALNNALGNPPDDGEADDGGPDDTNNADQASDDLPDDASNDDGSGSEPCDSAPSNGGENNDSGRESDGNGAGSTERPLIVGSMRDLPRDTPRPRPMPNERGRAVGHRTAAPDEPVSVIATAAFRALNPDSADTRTDVRVAPAERTIILCVDLSGSMGADERAEAATGVALGILTGAYEQRDRVGLVTFRGDDAEVVLKPTASVEVARHRLSNLATGGPTPLAAGLAASLQVAQRELRHDRAVHLMAITDGRASGPTGLDDAYAAAAQISRAGVTATVLDCEHGTKRLGLAAKVADAMGAKCVSMATAAP